MLENTYFIYQPNFFEGSIVSYEALIRVKGSDDLPLDFISTINNKEEFDKAVISHIISDKLSLNNQDNVHISINISVSSLESESFIEYCESVFKHHKGFSFELNFKHQNVNLEKIRSNMQRLKKLNLFFTLDDYGTECKNSDPLLSLNFDYIKIDRSLISPIEDDYLSFCFLRSLYQKLNKFLGNNVVIKGIENVNQLNLIQSLGSVISQGYYLSYPISLSELDQKLKSHGPTIDNQLNDSMPPIDRFIYNINVAKDNTQLNQALEALKPQDPFNLLGIDYNNFNLQALNTKYQELLDGIKSPSILFTTNLMKHCNCLFILRDEHGVAIYNNKKHTDYLGCDLVGMPVSKVLERFPDYQTCLQLDQQLLNNESDILMSNETVEVDSTTTHFHTYRQKIKYFDKTFVMIFVYEDNQDVQSPIDPLTGCFTKAKLNHIDVNAYNTMVFIDLDGFKNINDQYGHQFGDQQLKEAARLINQNLRKEDLLIRFGGDEFVLCFDSHSIQDIQTKMRMIRTNLEHHFQQREIFLSYSFGVTPLDMDIQLALDSADKKMYINKRKRKKIINNQAS
ncbi:GGDEF domain-containing protein [Aliivibrio sp. S2TY2]|uniref:GGDEF domain-containing protein n=1 Tax=unclassified Aliivibrio TaxID=2645654 RepID=UPI0023787638|nr:MULTISPECIES: GGDEF domain-containing protein [unclassified Aliivibrio]MDD9175276.1 GGDEF domain-containing protein [Aliivibrio sp. S3TY1]MDD9192355.1 GGDEF domain-containing protein [Aliivibrio sp. S2TY2]